MIKHTEKTSLYNDLEKKSSLELLKEINQEDQKVALAVQESIPQIEPLVEAIVSAINNGGRLFYLGAGTSGRLGIVDASECPPTFGVSHDLVIGLMAGGDKAMRKAVEFAEDDPLRGWKDLLAYNINEKDIVIGIAASGTTPYVIGALKECQKNNIKTGSISCNEQIPLSEVADFPIEMITGPEYVTGSTRMKAGTAQKLCLNMISTAVMIRIGRVIGNKMVDMQLSNNKLLDRGTRMILEQCSIEYETAMKLLQKEGSVRAAIEAFNKK